MSSFGVDTESVVDPPAVTESSDTCSFASSDVRDLDSIAESFFPLTSQQSLKTEGT